jgi:hypothetical protein
MICSYPGLGPASPTGRTGHGGSQMDTTAIAILVVLAVVIIILAFAFRDRIKFGLKGPLGTGLDFEGQNRATRAAHEGEREPGKSVGSPAEAARTTTASAGGVAIGGGADKARISTHVQEGYPPER